MTPAEEAAVHACFTDFVAAQPALYTEANFVKAERIEVWLRAAMLHLGKPFK